MARQSWIFGMIIVLGLGSWSAAASRRCPPVAFPGYKYLKTEKGLDRYFAAKTGVTLTVRCPPPTVKAEDLIEKLKIESSVRNTVGDAVYFEFNAHGRFRRVYVITREPTVELTFSAKRRHRRHLDDTQILVETAFKRRK